MSDGNGLLKALVSPEHLMRALRMLDRTAITMMLVTWVGAAAMMGLALYTARTAGKAREEAEKAAAIEPIVPDIQRSVLPRAELTQYADRLRQRFDKIAFNALPDNGLEIASSEAQLYLDWLAAMSYLDTVAPQVRWSVRDLCVGGECGTGSVMRATLVGEKIIFKLPALDFSKDDAKEGQKS